MFMLAWLEMHGIAHCAPYSVLLLLALEHDAQTAPPSVLPLLRVMASLEICNEQQLFEAVKSGACELKGGLGVLVQTAALVQLLDNGQRVSAATCKLWCMKQTPSSRSSNSSGTQKRLLERGRSLPRRSAVRRWRQASWNIW